MTMLHYVESGKGSLPTTGQTTSYVDYDDGYYRCGLPKVASGAVDNRVGNPTSTTRFVDNGDNTITDNMTGLMWPIDAPTDIGSPFDAPVANWATAISDITALNGASGFAGYTDWRLANLKEMVSIIDCSQNNPAIYAEFTLVPYNAGVVTGYWSSTTYVTTTYAHFVSILTSGGMQATVKTAATGCALPVRGGIINQNG